MPPWVDVGSRRCGGRPVTGPRVVFLDHSAALAGAELFLLRLLERAELPRPRVLLFEDGPLRPELERRGVDVEVVPLAAEVVNLRSAGGRAELGRLVARGGDVARFGADLARRLRAARPDLVYSNSAKAHVLGLPLARGARMPTLLHLHNGIAADTYGRGNRAALRAAARVAGSVLVNSEATRATLPPRVAARAHLFYCPTDVPSARPGPREQDGVLRVALVGRVSPWKGQDLAVRALARLRERHPGPVHLHVIGEALFERDLAYRREVAEMVARLGLEDLVTWHGHVADVPAALALVDVVVHTSLVPEPMGQVIPEAQAAGRPVVAAAAGGPLELIADGVDGLLYPMGDVDALADRLARLAAPAAREDLAAAAWHRVQRLSYEERVPDWRRLVSAAAGRSAR